MIPDRFKIPDTAPDPFHILSIEGLDKSGKTDLACRAPGAVAFQSWDFSTQGVVQKYMDEKTIMVGEYTVTVDPQIDFDFRKEVLREAANESADEQATRVMRESWKPFTTDYNQLMADPSIRTVVWDTASEVNEVSRLAHMGKLEKNPQLAYGPVNTEFKMLVRKAHEYRKNLVLLHQLATEYKEVEVNGRAKSIETGRMKRRGNASIGFLVHSYVEAFKVPPQRNTAGIVTAPPKFMVRILTARLNPEADGTVLESPDWVSLMMLLAPSVTAEAWL